MRRWWHNRQKPIRASVGYPGASLTGLQVQPDDFMSDPTSLYPAIEPFYIGRLPVSSLHSLYIERSGTEGGAPLFFLHGGPGSQCSADHRRYFDPDFYDIVLFDQRGCGRSTPPGEVAENDTQALVEDLNAIRRALGITRKITLFGGSWGSTLALAYAARYQQSVEAMILRGVFLGTDAEVQWFTHGLARFACSAWEEFTADATDDLVAHYHAAVNSPLEHSACQAARRWARYEALAMQIGTGAAARNQEIVLTPDKQLLARVRVQLHYLSNHCFLGDNYLLESARDIDIPVTIVQGGLDFICPPISAWRLSRALPRASLRLVADAGHNGLSAQLARALTEEANGLRDRLGKTR